jgi:hypothetical protein
VAMRPLDNCPQLRDVRSAISSRVVTAIRRRLVFDPEIQGSNGKPLKNGEEKETGRKVEGKKQKKRSRLYSVDGDRKIPSTSIHLPCNQHLLSSPTTGKIAFDFSPLLWYCTHKSR